MRKIYMLVLIPAIAILVAGCSKAPVTELSAADQAVESARNTQAAKYAQAEWQMALDTLQAAKAEKARQDGRFALFRGYGGSRDLALRASVLAAQAQTKAEAALNELRREAEALLAEIETALPATEQAVATAPVAKGTRSEIELMKQDVLALRNQYTEAQADLARSDFETAKAKARSILDRCSEITTAIEAAKAKRGSGR